MKKLITFFTTLCFVLTLCASCTPDDSSALMPGDTNSGYLLNIITEGGGTVPANLNGRYSAGTQIEVAATPNLGYSFYRWIISDNDIERHSIASLTDLYKFSMPDNDVTMVATFRKSNELFSVAYVNGPGGGFAGGEVARYSGTYCVGDQIPMPLFYMRVFPGYTRDKVVAYSKDGEVLWTKHDNEWAPPFTMPACDVTIVAMFKEK